VWTLNKPELIQAAIDNNVDGVLTDDVASTCYLMRFLVDASLTRECSGPCRRQQSGK
jgi:hypothetical protein